MSQISTVAEQLADHIMSAYVVSGLSVVEDNLAGASKESIETKRAQLSRRHLENVRRASNNEPVKLALENVLSLSDSDLHVLLSEISSSDTPQTLIEKVAPKPIPSTKLKLKRKT